MIESDEPRTAETAYEGVCASGDEACRVYAARSYERRACEAASSGGDFRWRQLPVGLSRSIACGFRCQDGDRRGGSGRVRVLAGVDLGIRRDQPASLTDATSRGRRTDRYRCGVTTNGANNSRQRMNPPSCELSNSLAGIGHSFNRQLTIDNRQSP